MRTLGSCSALLALCVAALAHPANNIVVPQKDAVSTEKPAASADLKDLPLPVNEQYPSAVLFGGTCGGTIISAKWILTAGHCSVGAHCLCFLGDYNISRLVPSTLFTGGRGVVAGTNNTGDGSGVYRRVKRMVIHPLFSVGPYWVDADEFDIKQVGARYDYLLAELAEPLPLDGRTIKAATLDDQPSLTAGLEVGYAGYGTDHHGGSMRSEMHGMELEIKPDSECSRLEQFFKDDMICTRGRAPRFDSACNGDSGSGLLDKSGRIVGIASWVENDAHECKNGNLVVFSRVSAARDWIRQVTKI